MSGALTRVEVGILALTLMALVFCPISIGATDTPADFAPPPPSPPSSSTDSQSFFLAQYVSVQIPGGIRGLAPGTRATVITNLGNRLRVKADDIEFEVRKDQVTPDQQMALRASQVDTQTQQKLAASMATQQQQLFQDRQREQIKQQEAKSARDRLRDLEQRYNALQQEEENLQSRIGEAQQPVVARYSKSGTRIYDKYANPMRTQLPLLRSRLQDVQREKKDARRQLEAAQRQR